MIAPLSRNTQAILLLTAPLIIGRNDLAAELLTFGEYTRLARLLRERQLEPADLIGSEAKEAISQCGKLLDQARLEILLGRGFQLSQAVDHWNNRAIWVISRADETYPRWLKTRLKEDAPPILYGCGESALLETGGLAVVGSRQVDDELLAYTEGIGRLAAAARLTLVSGGAKGIDRAAMHGAMVAGGYVAGVMSDSLERAVMARDNREALMEGRLVLISPYDPQAGFNVGHAMQRNKLIYALADAALVVTADLQKGGTWEGAVEQLERLRLVPIYVRTGTKSGKGNNALIQRGGLPWPEPRDGVELAESVRTAAATVIPEAKQEMFSFTLRENPPTSTKS